MRRVAISADAAADLEALHDFIALDNPRAAERLVERLEGAIGRLARNPAIGHSREDLTTLPVLFWPVGHYLIVYRHSGTSLDVLAVVHGARDVSTLLTSR